MKKVLFTLFGLVLLTGCGNVLDNEKNNFCEGCVFGRENSSIGLPSNSEYSSDYLNLGNAFLGQIVKDGYVKRSFVCGIEQGNLFCIEVFSDQSPITESNRKVLKETFPDCDLDFYGSDYIRCDGSDVRISISGNGSTIADALANYSCYNFSNDDQSLSFCLDY